MTDTNGADTTPPPSTPPRLPPSPPVGTPLAYPPVWQAALLLAGAGLAGATAFNGFIVRAAEQRRGTHALAFLSIASVAVAAGAFVLLAFRVWPRRVRKAWPSLAQCLLIAAAAAGLAIGACGGWSAIPDRRLVWPLTAALAAAFVAGAAVTIGAGELFVIVIVRLIMKKLDAR
jgi:hypothetical protein